MKLTVLALIDNMDNCSDLHFFQTSLFSESKRVRQRETSRFESTCERSKAVEDWVNSRSQLN